VAEVEERGYPPTRHVRFDVERIKELIEGADE
jgi:hypothetical protein